MKSTIIPDKNRSVETGDQSSSPKKPLLINRLTRYLSYVGMVVMMGMVLLVTIDVAARYVFNNPINGSTDIIEIMMVIVVYSCLAYGATEDKHVRIDFLYSRLSTVARGYVDIVTSILSILIVVLISWQLGERAVNIINNPPGPTTTYFGWELMPFIAFASFGSALLAIQLCTWLYQAVKQAFGKSTDYQSTVHESEAVPSPQE
ncbi:TRAP transporter small permease [Bacillus tuaregi]|uniref:TRAP transporter small permease n=1 Tax=Bacillus tuaregi TaxID=1816695 RepID=UPI0008F92D6B|nr:TRAP transporter small permease [Bacillus tuaregi]